MEVRDLRHPAHPRHALKVYRTPGSLARTVAEFVCEGLSRGEPALLICTPEHDREIASELRRCGVDVTQARHRGDLVVLDARDTLELFVIDGQASAALFTSYMSGLVAQMRRGRGRSLVRAFGEMVDVLWASGQAHVGLELESLWNGLLHTHDLLLLCAYAADHLRSPDAYRQVCGHHGRVLDEMQLTNQ